MGSKMILARTYLAISWLGHLPFVEHRLSFLRMIFNALAKNKEPCIQYNLMFSTM